MLGFSEDYKSERHIQNAINDFGKVILWEEDDRFLARLMVRARVRDVQAVPQLVVYSDTAVVDGESWTIQCEVVQRHQIGGGPPEEDPVPDELELGEMGVVVPLDFFGLGQPVMQPE